MTTSEGKVGLSTDSTSTGCTADGTGATPFYLPAVSCAEYNSAGYGASARSSRRPVHFCGMAHRPPAYAHAIVATCLHDKAYRPYDIADTTFTDQALLWRLRTWDTNHQPDTHHHTTHGIRSRLTTNSSNSSPLAPVTACLLLVIPPYLIQSLSTSVAHLRRTASVLNSLSSLPVDVTSTTPRSLWQRSTPSSLLSTSLRPLCLSREQGLATDRHGAAVLL